MDKLHSQDADQSRLCLSKCPWEHREGESSREAVGCCVKEESAGCWWRMMEVSNHPRDDISPRATLLPGARAANHTTAAHLAHPLVYVALSNPSQPPGQYLAIAGWRNGVRLLPRWRVRIVGDGALVTCLACSSCVASACIWPRPVAGALPPWSETLDADLIGNTH